MLNCSCSLSIPKAVTMISKRRHICNNIMIPKMLKLLVLKLQSAATLNIVSTTLISVSCSFYWQQFKRIVFIAMTWTLGHLTKHSWWQVFLYYNLSFIPNILIIMYKMKYAYLVPKCWYLNVLLWFIIYWTFTLFTPDPCPAALTTTITVSCYSVTIPRETTSHAAIL